MIPFNIVRFFGSRALSCHSEIVEFLKILFAALILHFCPPYGNCEIKGT